METTTHEYYVSPEVAELLKKAGFDWLTRYSYDLYLYNTEGEKRVIDGFASTFCNEHNGLASMPTLEVAQRWLREVKNIYVESVLCVNRGTSGHSYGFSIAEISADLSMVKILYPLTYFDEEKTKGFKKYELSLEAGIKKALEIISEKG